MDEEALKTKLATIAELRAETSPEGELQVEFQFSLVEGWQRQLFAALARRYGLVPFRYSGQRHTTVMLKAPERFVDEAFWPQYEQLSATLRGWLEEATERIIREGLQAEGSIVEARVDAPQDSGSAGSAV
jgi:hypothetical protein